MVQHVNETISAIKNIIEGPEGQTLTDHLREWSQTGNNAHNAESKLKLGGSRHSKAEKDRRIRIRACLLAGIAFGIKKDNQIPEYQKALNDQSAIQLVGELRTYLSYCAEVQGSLIFGPSFRLSPGTATLKTTCKAAYDLAKMCLYDALEDLSTITQGSGESFNRYKAYFGDYDITRVKTVTDNLRTIMLGLFNKKLWLYYRGNTVGTYSQKSDWPFAMGDISIGSRLSTGNHFGASLRPNQQTIWTPANPLQKQDDLHVLIGSMSDGKDQKVMAGVIIHELSHYLCDTRDVKTPLIAHPYVQSSHVQNDFSLMSTIINNSDGYLRNTPSGKQPVTRQQWLADKQLPQPQRQYKRRDIDDAYGTVTCMALADCRPEKAIVNADSYALYCMQFDPG